MAKNNDVYVAKNGRIGKVTGHLPKDALLFTSSNKSLSQINREKRARMSRSSDFVLERIEAAKKS